MRRVKVFLVGLVLSASLAQPLQSKPAIQPSKLEPGLNDTNITKLTAWILQQSHFVKQPFNDEVSSRFLERYLDAVDHLRLWFLQTDVEEFDVYRQSLDDLTLKAGDTTPARVIFTRLRERVEQQYDFVTELLKTEKFEFNGNDRFQFNRKNAPRPQTLEDAKRLWRERLRYEYLQEKLSIGRPELICQAIQEVLTNKNDSPPPRAKPTQDEIAKVELKHPKAVAVRAALEGKLGKEKADEIARLVDERLGSQDSPEKIVNIVRTRLDESNAQEIGKKLSKRYDRILRTYWEYDHDDVLQFYLTSLAHVYDPHSDYLGKAELENFSIGMKLSLFGIGALLGSEDGYCKIQSLVAGGPAERSKKLKANDKIVAVAQGDDDPVDVVDMKLRKVVDQIRGPKDTTVRLTIIPADAPDPSVRETVTLIRDEIKLEDQEAKARLIDWPVENGKTVRLGLIDLPSFYSSFEIEGRGRSVSEPKSTTADVSKLVRKLVKEKVEGIILDLRRNGGGSLEEAINLTGLFIKEGPVVQVKAPDGDPIVDRDPDPDLLYDGPLVVLTSRYSASASEILAGALQDYGRALVVGDSSTHGKGTVQSLINLRPIMARRHELASTNDPGAIKITIRKFYRASGESTQKRGVIPDIILPSVNNHGEVGEAALDNALAWDTIPAASFEKFNLVNPILPELKKRTEARVAKDPDFDFIRGEIDRYKQLLEDKTVSLNEAQRLKEKEEADQRVKARKEELLARGEPPGTAYEITLKIADTKGLPPPISKTNAVSTARVSGKTAVGAPAPVGASVRTPSAGTLSAPAKTEPDQAAQKGEKTSVAQAREGDEDESPGDSEVPNIDATLEEAKRILVDIIALSAKPDSLAISAPTASKD